MKRKIVRFFLTVGLWSGALMFVFFAAATLWFYHKGLFVPPDFSLIRQNNEQETSKIFDRDGNVLREYCEYCKEKTTLREMGKFPQFAVAVEDKDFWTRRFAFSPNGIIRAAIYNFKTGKRKQGGSTISQQMARNIFATEELWNEWNARTPEEKVDAQNWRKLREIWLATQIEKRLNRAQILELYLNSFYCGNGHYGVKACSDYYFGKSPEKLDPAQVATILGLLRTPQIANNLRAMTIVRNRVLSQLASEHAISEEEADNSRRETLGLKERIAEGEKPTAHFSEFVRREMTKKAKAMSDGRSFSNSGYKVHTELDPRVESVMYGELKKSMEGMVRRNPLLTDLRGAAMLIDAKSGAIIGWVQLPDFNENKFLINQIFRQPGSAFKPFEFAALLLKGWRLSCEDEGNGPCKLDDSRGLSVPMGSGRKIHYTQNFPYKSRPRYLGLAPVIQVWAESRNNGTLSGVKGVRGSRVPYKQRVSKEEIIDMAVKAGIARPTIDPGLTVGLGSIDVSLPEMLKAWTGFMGGRVEPYAFQRIEDGDGNVIPFSHAPAEQVFDEEFSLKMIRGFRATVEFPTGTAARAKRELNFQIMGKTGTATNWAGETTDNWFVGCSPSYCMAIWIGRENKLPLAVTRGDHSEEIQETGGKNALPVFIATMKTIYANREKETFPEMTNPLKPFVYVKEEAK